MSARLDELWARFVDGDALTAEESAALHDALAADENHRRARLRDHQLDGALRGMGGARHDADAFVRELFGRVAAESSSEPFVARMNARVHAALPRRRRWVRVLAGMAGAAALAVFVAAAVRSDRRQRAQHAIADGYERPFHPPGAAPAPRARLVAAVRAPMGAAFVVVEGRRAAAQDGDVLAPGAGMVTVGADSAASVAFLDGSQLDLGGDAVLTSLGATGGRRAFLAAGTLRASVKPQPAGNPLVIATPHADAIVVGTRFTLEVSAAETRLSVSEGRVRLRRTVGGDGEASVAAGQTTVASERLAPVATMAAPGGTAVLVVGDVPARPGDEAVRRRLTALGFDVKVRAPGVVSTAELRTAALILLSSTVPSADFNIPLREVPVPVICWELNLFDDLGMAGTPESQDRNRLEWSQTVVVKDPRHPLAAGLAGPQVITSEVTHLVWAAPGPLATWVATFPETPMRAAVFAYEKGTPLATGGAAPARRTGIFLSNATAPLLTPAGWALFDAAVKWTAERRVEP